jgi:hypothetical protein
MCSSMMWICGREMPMNQGQDPVVGGMGRGDRDRDQTRLAVQTGLYPDSSIGGRLRRPSFVCTDPQATVQYCTVVSLL